MELTRRNQILESVYLWVHTLVNQRCRKHPAREDLAQECFLRLLKLAPKYDAGRAKVTTWASVVVHSFLSQRLKQLARLKPDNPEFIDLHDVRDKRTATPLQELIAREQVDRTARALAACDRDAADMITARAEGATLAGYDRSVSRERVRQKYARAAARCRETFERLDVEC